MKFVVTGALGHIGSRLIRQLPSLFPAPEIIMIDDLSTQRYPSLFDLRDHATYRFEEADVTTTDLRPIVENADVVVHLAALTDAAGSFDNAEEVERINYAATVSVAKACAAVGAGMIHASSTSIYGAQNEKVDETCSPDNLKPQSPYAETKLREEIFLADMAVETDLRHVTCRFGTIFGTSPGMRFHTAVNKFCWQASMGLPLTVWRTAMDQKRSYLDLGDAIQAIALISTKEIFDGRVYNVLTTNTEVREIIDIIRSNVPGLEVELVDAKIMNQLSYEVDFDRFRDFGFTPRGSLTEGIEETLRLLAGAHYQG